VIMTPIGLKLRDPQSSETQGLSPETREKSPSNEPLVTRMTPDWGVAASKLNVPEIVCRTESSFVTTRLPPCVAEVVYRVRAKSPALMVPRVSL
jgi:hypothetical protein